MGRPAGSPNKDKPFRDALRMEVAAANAGQADEPVPARSLRALARSLLDRAAESDVALKEVADRLDGKVPQGHEGTDGPPINLRQTLERVIVEAKHTDSSGLPPAT